MIYHLTRIAFDEITVDDPNSACSEFEHKLQFKRSGSIVEVLGTARLQSSPTHYHVFVALEVQEDGALICERQWRPVIPRNHS